MSRQDFPESVGCVLLALVLVFTASGCETLLEEDQFREGQVPIEKRRQIEPLDLSEVPVHEEPTGPAATEPAAEAVTLRLEQCRALALENNLDLKVQLLAPTIAAQDVSAEEAKFESVFFFDASLSRSDQPQQDFVPIGEGLYLPSISGSQTRSWNSRYGVQVPLRTGGTLTFNMADARRRSLNVGSDPWYTNAFAMSISQPLLRNAGQRITMHSIRIARYAQQEVDLATKLEVIAVVAAADRAYWRLYAARRELEVREQQYELAKAQLERAERFVEAGEMASVEVLRAEAGLAQQLAAIITAENALRDRQREFKRMLNKPGMPIDSETVVVPATLPDPVHYDFEQRQMVAQAMDNRIDLLRLELQILQNLSTIDYLRNQTLPLVSLQYTYNINGVGPTGPDSYDMLFDKNFEDHRMGLTLSVPLGNERARSQLRRSLYQRRQHLATQEAQQLLVKQEVLAALDQVETNWQQILANRQNALLQGRLYQAEIRQFEVGERTSTDVLQAQTNFANAQSGEIRALVEYEIALVDLAYATGTLLGASRVDWEPAVPDIGVRP